MDRARRELRRGGALIPVEPLVFDLIAHLADNAERVVSKSELVDAIWSGRVIADATLSTSIKSARRALGDSGAKQRFIKTYHRRGFRYVGPPLARASIAAGGGGSSHQPSPTDAQADLDLSPPRRPSIAVLPFATLGGHAEQQVLAGGLLQDVTQRLARARWLFVSARASAQQFRFAASDPTEIGAALGVKYLLHGSVIRSAGRFRLTVALIATTDGEEIWAETFDRKIEDVFAVQDEVSDLIAAAVESEIDLKERRLAAIRPLASLDAWSSYHRANDLLYKFAPDERAEAERLFLRARELDPGSARVSAGLSFLHWLRAFFEVGRKRAEEVAIARAFAEESVALDPLDAQAHWALGRASMIEGDLEGAADELSKSVELNVNYAKGRFSLGYAKLFTGDYDGALEHAASARRLSPYDPMSFAYLGLFAEAKTLAGDAAAGLIWARRAARQPNAHHHILAVAAWVSATAGDDEGARGYMSEVRRLRPSYSDADFLRAYPHQGRSRALVTGAFRRLGV